MYSVADIKDNTGGKHVLPREGSRLRRLYDILYANAGTLVPLHTILPLYNKRYAAQTAVAQLRDFYGLDIRCLWHGWLLAGVIHDDGTYTDFVADRMKKRPPHEFFI